MVQALKPGEDGATSVSQRPNGAYRARARLRLFDSTEVQVARHGPSKAAARTALQNEITERLRAPAGSRMLRPDTKVGLAARQWIEEGRLQSTWPRPLIHTRDDPGGVVRRDDPRLVHQHHLRRARRPV